MRVEFNLKNIKSNIEKAERISRKPISLMFKDFYEDLYYRIQPNNVVFSKHIKDSVCYSIGNEACVCNEGCVIIRYEKFLSLYSELGMRSFYVPINAKDDREGLCVEEANDLCRKIKEYDRTVCLYGMITAGCLNEKHPSVKELCSIWNGLKNYIISISIGGSFWLAKCDIPDFISDIRIGEYMLFGTIPYNDKNELKGLNGVQIKTNVIGCYPERKEIVLDCGYAMADVQESKIIDNSLTVVDVSSEYTMCKTEKIERYCIGDEVKIIPNYKSLVKLRNAERNYI